MHSTSQQIQSPAFQQCSNPYHRSLAFHAELVDELRSHTITFEKSREIVNKWVEQPWLEDTGWEAAWEDICEAEVERWGAA